MSVGARPWLVFGLSGSMAAPLRVMLGAAGLPVIAVSRRAQSMPSKEGGIEWRQGSLQSPPMLAEDYAGVLSLGPLDAFSAWFEAMHVRTQKVIAIGSMSEVFKRDSPSPVERELAQRLKESRQRLLATCAVRGTPALVLRPSLVLGGDGREPDGFSALCALAARWRIAPLPRPAPGLRQPLHRADLCELLLGLMHGVIPGAADAFAVGTLDLGGAERLRLDTMLDRLYQARAPGAWRMPVPLGLLRVLAPIMPTAWRAGLARAACDQTVDTEPAQRLLAWRPERHWD